MVLRILVAVACCAVIAFVAVFFWDRYQTSVENERQAQILAEQRWQQRLRDRQKRCEDVRDEYDRRFNRGLVAQNLFRPAEEIKRDMVNCFGEEFSRP